MLTNISLLLLILLTSTRTRNFHQLTNVQLIGPRNTNTIFPKVLWSSPWHDWPIYSACYQYDQRPPSIIRTLLLWPDFTSNSSTTGVFAKKRELLSFLEHLMLWAHQRFLYNCKTSPCLCCCSRCRPLTSVYLR